jgi:hypothetical protein
MMRSIKPLFVAILALVLGAYAFDCEAATTPEQAMQCCKSMLCSSHGHHGQDCCKTMPTMPQAIRSSLDAPNSTLSRPIKRQFRPASAV